MSGPSEVDAPSSVSAMGPIHILVNKDASRGESQDDDADPSVRLVDTIDGSIGHQAVCAKSGPRRGRVINIHRCWENSVSRLHAMKPQTWHEASAARGLSSRYPRGITVNKICGWVDNEMALRDRGNEKSLGITPEASKHRGSAVRSEILARGVAQPSPIGADAVAVLRKAMIFVAVRPWLDSRCSGSAVRHAKSQTCRVSRQLKRLFTDLNFLANQMSANIHSFAIPLLGVIHEYRRLQRSRLASPRRQAQLSGNKNMPACKISTDWGLTAR